MKKIISFIVLLSALWAYPQNDKLFEGANTEYNEGNYEKAIEDYLAILATGQHSAELYFNLGNAYYKLNQIAPSIYYYEKALLLKPHDAEVRNNLSYAQKMALDVISPIPAIGFSKFYKRFTEVLSFDQWAYVSIAFMILFVLLYIAFYYFRYASSKRIAFILSLISLLISIFTVIIAYTEYGDFKADQPAIVFKDEVIVRAEPNNRSQEVFVLHEGAKVNVLEALNDFQKIQIPDGKIGWLPKESIKMLKDF